ncbi:activator-dependent family glycosyltransferase [Micromonospora sp. NPDC047793]|uniref:activator-dependent family glycosyltransferase n=1 Tax=unclassified Micromonospora TaxID=2617518 RepID=UPI00103309D9|nr:activator-dependent family glycosyltransferase [Verrucosispora sp. SN26_14.1]TBL45473.1 activator-dependent family glycosyltransferase [Verrucosispora sp. SN26_14.1]
MKVLFTTYPEKTHFMLQAPLAWALRTAGHDVRVAVQPKFADVVTQAGLTAVPVGTNHDLWDFMHRVGDWLGPEDTGWPTPYDAAERDPADISWEYLHSGYQGQAIRWHKTSNVPLVTGLVEFAGHWQPDLIIWEPLTYAGGIAAKALGVAHARLLIGADVYGITRDHFLRLNAQRSPDDRDDPMANWLGRYAEKYGGQFSEDMMTGHFTINQLPPSLAINADLHIEYLRYVPYGGPAVVPRWLWEPPRKPRVALTMGLTATERAAGYAVSVQDVLDSLADLDIELVATIADSEQARLRSVPDNTRLVSYVPLQALLPTCSVVIHHAGVGTLASSALYGVPQHTVPWDVDQPALSERVAVRGAGLNTHATKATGQTIRENVLRLLHEPSLRAGADSLRTEVLAQPTPNDLVPRLEELTQQYTGKG